MKYYLIAGEASGDLHGGNLISQLKIADKNAVFRGFGGEKMEAAGMQLTVHYRQMAFMGAFEVLANLRKINSNFVTCRKDILEFKPDAVILIDYAGFNLRMARFAKENNIKTLFYISPKVWAWNKSRIKKIKAYIDQLYLILPFEKEFYSRYGYNSTVYVGNPLTDAIDTFRNGEQISANEFRQQNGLNSRPVIALLAGSRKQEIIRLLPEMLKVSARFPECQFVVAGAPSVPDSLYDKIIKGTGVKIVYNQTYQLLSHAHAAIVASGTATLETALFNVPQVVVYKFNTVSFLMFRPFIWVKYFSLVNIIMNKPVVKEILQFGIARKAHKELGRILNDSVYYQQMKAGYASLAEFIGSPGSSERAAKHIIEFLQTKQL
ncbi:MAG: lipid-A-disaccharide synthase [Bacteroidales bacterium]|nr:lipid-A-disaccharide synthase [Bacteroidales bacterium]